LVLHDKIIDKHNLLPGLENMERLAIELGCGQKKISEDVIGIDAINTEAADIIADISQGLSFLPDNSVDIIYSNHVLEHFDDLGFIMGEIYRVLKPGGKTIGQVPHFSNPYYYSDYTHKTTFGLYTFSYFTSEQRFKRKVPSFYNDCNFKLIRIKLVFYSPFKLINALRKIFTLVFNSSRFMQEYYEGSLSTFIPAHEIAFELEKS